MITLKRYRGRGRVKDLGKGEERKRERVWRWNERKGFLGILF